MSARGERGAPVAWPVPWEAVEGVNDGVFAHAQAWAVRAVVGGLARLPWGAQKACARALSRAARALDRRHSRQAREYLAAAYGPGLDPRRREDLVRSAYEHLFLLTLEGARFDAVAAERGVRALFDLEVSPDVERVLASGRGALLLTAHTGVWEFLPPLVVELGFRPLYVVSRPPRNRPLSRLAQAVREARGFRLLHRHGAAAAIPKVVAAGGFVGLMVDQRARQKTVLLPFFGRPAHCERAVAIFARRLGVPVLMASAWRTQERWRFGARFDRVLWPAELADLSVEQVASRINAELERMILARPEQYFWLHDRYRGAPATAAGGAPMTAANGAPMSAANGADGGRAAGESA